MQTLKDKLKHFVLGAVVAGAGAALSQLTGGNLVEMVVVGTALSVVVGGGWEAWQHHFGRGHASWADAVATVSGGLLATGFMWGAAA